MRTAAFAIALLMSGAAIAQTTTTTTVTQPDLDVDANVGVQPDGDLDVDADVDLDKKTTTTTTTTGTAAHGTMNTGTTAQGSWNTGTTASTQGSMSTSTGQTWASSSVPASGAVVQPGNMNPERDARGILVISAPAVVPSGFNGVASTGVGGPLLDAQTGAQIDAADDSYRACTATVTDNCLQTYERGRKD